MKLNSYDYWKVVCGIVILSSAFFITIQNIYISTILYLCYGGGGSALILDVLTSKLSKGNRGG